MSDEFSELAETLRAMSDEELTERWSCGYFSDVAVEVARLELARRQIRVPEFVKRVDEQRDDRPEGKVAFETVARSLDSFQIEMLRARLEAEGIAAFTIDQGINQANALVSIAVGGTRLMVPRENADEARRIIALVRAGAFQLREGDDWS